MHKAWREGNKLQHFSGHMMVYLEFKGFRVELTYQNMNQRFYLPSKYSLDESFNERSFEVRDAIYTLILATILHQESDQAYLVLTVFQALQCLPIAGDRTRHLQAKKIKTNIKRSK